MSGVQPRPGKQGLKRVVVVQEEQPPPPGEPPFLLLSVTLGVMEYPFGWFRSAVLAMSPPHHLPTLSLLAPGGLEGVLIL